MQLIEMLVVSGAISVVWNWWRGKEINASNILKVDAVAFLAILLLWGFSITIT